MNVNDNGKLNLDKSNVDNDNSARVLMMTITQTNYAGRLLRQPVICLRASFKRACSLSRLVSLSRFSSSIARNCNAKTSELADASIRWTFLIVFGACLAFTSDSRTLEQVATADSPMV